MQSIDMRRTRIFVALTSALLALPLSATPLLATGPGLDPSSVEAVIFPGDHLDVQKTVHTPTIPPKPDIYFLADSTGSMGPAIATVQTNAAAVLAAVDGATTDPRYGAGDYKDFQSPQLDPYAFNNAAPIPAADDNGAAALAAIAAWSASGGYDGSEAQLYALNQIADGAASFRADSTRVVVWFGDAPGHDPICSAISGLGYDITEASVTAKLVAADIRVVAISLDTGFYSAGLNDDPSYSAYGYTGVCTIDGSSGQATRIANATGGVVLTGVGPDDIADAILEGLENLPAEVAMQSDCVAPIHTSFSPASQTVPSGTDADFTETISVDSNAPGGTYTCKDWATINGQPMTDSGGNVIYELKTIKVPEGFLTGGGQINTGHGKDVYKVSFGGNVGFLADFSLVGHWNVVFHDVSLASLDGAHFNGDDPTALQFSLICGPAPNPPPANANFADFVFGGSLNGTPGYTLHVWATDYGEPGINSDAVRIALYDPADVLVYTTATDFPDNDNQAGCPAGANNGHQLDAGNLQIHSGVK